MIENFIISTSVKNINTSLQRLIEGGTPILIATNINIHNTIKGKEIDPLLQEITRECLQEYK